jgi:hypothetical protein
MGDTAPIIIPDSSFVNPSFFSGTASEDALSWITYVENWLSYKALTVENQVKLFPLLFRSAAADWFQALGDGEKDTFAHLKAAFEARYYPTDLTRWVTMSDIWSKKQGPNETVDDYITNLQKLARIAKVTDADLQRFAAIKGLLPEIRKHVLTQNPTTLAQVLTAARIAEQAMKADGSQDFVMAMSRLEQKLDSIQVTPTSPRSSSIRNSSDQDSQHSEERYAGKRREPRSEVPYGSPNRRFDCQFDSSSRSPSPFGRERRGSSRPQFQPPEERRQPNNNGRQTSQRRVRFADNSKFTSYDNNGFNNRSGRSNSVCFKCGISGHIARNCFVTRVICRICGRRGHLATVCRSARMSSQ